MICTTDIYSPSPKKDTNGSPAPESSKTTGLPAPESSNETDEATDSAVPLLPRTSGVIDSIPATQVTTNRLVSSEHSKLAPPSGWIEGLSRYTTAKQLASKIGLHTVNVKADGACLFRAICVSKNRDNKDHDHFNLRQKTVDYMRKNSADFMQFAKDENLSFDEYLRLISDRNKMVGKCALPAIANILGKQINVYDSCRRFYVPNGFHPPCECTADLPRCPCINVLYRDTKVPNEGHYMALVRPARFNLTLPASQPCAQTDEGEGTPV